MQPEARQEGERENPTSAQAAHRPRLAATNLPPQLPSLQTMVLDQLVVSEEGGCWKPGCELLAAMLRWICETFAFETAYDLLQSFPRFCGYRRNAYSQQRTCESLLIEFWPDRMDFTRKRRLHMSWAGENKDYTRDEWLATLHQESRGKFEMEYRLWKRLICMTLPDVDRSTKEWDEASVEREATYRKQQSEAEQRQREEAEAKRRRIAEDKGRVAAQNAENQHPNFGSSEFRRSRRPPR